jgi:hypothetical protein
MFDKPLFVNPGQFTICSPTRSQIWCQSWR